MHEVTLKEGPENRSGWIRKLWHPISIVTGTISFMQKKPLVVIISHWKGSEELKVFASKHLSSGAVYTEGR